MKKYLALLVSTLLLVIVGQLFMRPRLRNESQILRDARDQTEQSLFKPKQVAEGAQKLQTGAESTGVKEGKLREARKRVLQKVTPELASTPQSATERRDLSGDVVSLARLVEARPLPPVLLSSYDLALTNVDGASVRVIGREPNVEVNFRLPGVPSEEIDTMTVTMCDFILDGMIVANFAGRLGDHGTNVGLGFIYRTRAEADAAAEILRRGTGK